MNEEEDRVGLLVAEDEFKRRMILILQSQISYTKIYERFRNY